MANDARLVWDAHRNRPHDEALATQSRFDAWVVGAVYEIFFFIGHLGQVIHAVFDVYVAGAAGADAATVVVEVDAVFFGQVEDGFAFGRFDGNGFFVGFDKSKMDGINVHVCRFNRWGVPC